MDICVFNLDKDGVQCTVVLHVDDLLITCVEEPIIDEVVAKLIEKYKTVDARKGSVHSYIGMTLDFSKRGKVKVTQEGYTHDIIKAWGTAGTASSPAAPTLFSIREKSPALSEEDRKKFHSFVAKVLYLGKRTRPELLPACTFLATRVTCANEDDMTKLDRIFKYLNGEPDLGLTLTAGQALNIFAYVDASYGVHADGKSHSGAVISLAGGPVFTKSSKQKLNSKSSTEAELIALSDSSSQVIWTRDFLIAQGYSIAAATIYQDNQSTIALVAKGRSTSEKSRHINIRFFFVKDRVDAGEVRVEYLPTKAMIADVLTKPLQGALFKELRDKLLNCSD